MKSGKKEIIFIKYLEKYDSKIKYMAWDFCSKYHSNLLSQEDIEQEIRIALLNSIDCFDETKQNQFSTFFYSVANNLLKNILRQESTEKRKANNFVLENTEEVLTILENYNSIKIEDEIMFNFFLEEVFEKLNNIDKELLRVIFEYTTVDKVSKKTGKSKSGLYKRLNNLKKKLQKEYEKWR